MDPSPLPPATDPPRGGLFELRERLDRRRHRFQLGATTVAVAVVIGLLAPRHRALETPPPGVPLARLSTPDAPPAARFEGVNATDLSGGEGATRIYLMMDP